MIFLSPMALYLFGLAGVIIAFYFLKQKVDILPVSALFLWQKFAEKPKSALRFFWSGLFGLLLQLLALAFLVSALANPVFYTKAQGPKRIAVIVDGSLSMQAKTVSKFTSSQVRKSQVTRYDEAVAKAIEMIDQNPAAQIAVIQAASQSAILSPLSHTRSEVIKALRRSRPTFQGNANLIELLELLKSQAPLESFDRIVYLADHIPQDELLKDLGIELVLVGAVPPRNVGLTTFAVRRQPKQFASAEYSLLITLENFSTEGVATQLKVSAGEEIIAEMDVAIEADTRESYEFGYSGPARLFKAQIFLDDDLEPDNVRYFALPNVPKARILWLGDENPFLKSALSALGEFAFERPSTAPSSKPTYYDLIVAYNTQLTLPAEGNILLIGSALPPLIERVEDSPSGFSVKVFHHSLIEGLDVSALFAAPFKKARVSERGQTIVTANTESGAYPLLYLYEGEKLRIVWLGLELRYANLVLSLDFPILIKNIIVWFLPWLYADTNLVTGDDITLRAGQAPPLKVIDPRGQISEFTGQSAFFNANLPGFYRLIEAAALPHRVLTYAANPPAAESDIRLKGQSQFIRKVESFSNDLRPSDFRLFRLFVLGGLILLLLELYLYDRSLFRVRA